MDNASQKEMNLEKKYQRLCELLREMESVLVGFSGGTDSAFLFKTAADVLGDNALGVTARSASMPGRDLEEVKGFVERYQLRHEFLDTQEVCMPNYRKNPPDRCYHCKREIFGRMEELRRQRGMKVLADGANADDTEDYRPGARAARELNLRSPLQEAGLGKEDIRALSRRQQLPTWNKPSSACLASRFPYGVEITGEGLRRIDRCENFLRELGLGQLRVRHHGSIARVEVQPEDFGKVLENRESITGRLKSEGYAYVALDLEGFRSGSLNVMLQQENGKNPEKDAGPEEKDKKKREPEFTPETFGPQVHTLYTDGACSGNPGPAAWAYVLFDGQGKEVARQAGFLEQATNNIAEYRALINGLKAAVENGVKRLQVLSDSELMVRQLNGAYRIKNRDLQHLVLEVQQLRRELESFKIDHVKREDNKLADWIASGFLKKRKKKGKNNH